jgi:DNA topoisomerase-1
MIVESPSKAPKIEGMLGKDQWRVLATKGHICVIDGGLEGISKIREDVTESVLKPPIKFKTKNYEFLKKAKQALSDSKGSNLYIATDDDREGEAIGYHVCRLLRINPLTVKRLRFNAIEKSAIESAIANPGVVDLQLVNAQLARQAIDLALGFTASPMLWKAVGGSTGLSAGRCQTPALTLVCNTHAAHSAATSELTKDPAASPVTWHTQTLLPACPTQFKSPATKGAKTKEEADERLSKFQSTECVLSPPESTTHSQRPPPPLSTARLQQQAGMGTKRCMNAAQKLYEGGHITYHRTDSTAYCEKFGKELIKFVSGEYGRQNVGFPPVAKGGAHEAIRVTQLSTKAAGKTADEKRLYQFIWRRTVATGMNQCEYERLQRTLSVEKLKAVACLNRMVTPGWTLVEKSPVAVSSKADWDKLMALPTGQLTKVPIITEAVPQVATAKHGPLTESQLVKTLESVGVGRPSTYASIVNKLFDRRYAVVADIEAQRLTTQRGSKQGVSESEWKEVELEYGGVKGRLAPTDLGIRVQKTCEEMFRELVAVETTAAMEEALDNVAKGEADWRALTLEYWDRVDKQVAQGKLLLKERKSQAAGSGSEGGSAAGSEIQDGGRKGGKVIGELENAPIELLQGRYGAYLRWNGTNVSVKGKRMPNGAEAQELVRNYLRTQAEVRDLGDGISIRPGKKGGKYAMVRRGKKAEFVPLKDCPHDVDDASAEVLKGWIKSRL